ncbi:MAG: hypothetical protein DMG03_28505, partial [Acidobacteria bacterium]
MEDRHRHRAVSAVLLLQRPVRPDGRTFQSRARRAVATGRGRGGNRARGGVYRRSVADSRFGHLRDGARRLRSRRPYLARHVQLRRARSAPGRAGADPRFAYRLVGFLTHDAGDGSRSRSQNAGSSGSSDTTEIHVRRHDIIGTATDIDRLVASRHVDRIIVGLSDRRGRLPIEALLRAKLSGVRVEDATTTYERLTGKILIDDLKPSWLIFSDGFRASRWTRFVKRMLDLALSIILGVITAPLMAATAIAIRLDSSGPVLYRQERVGEGGRTFTLCKFRSMRADAEAGTPIWAKDKDDRVTRVGRFIRLTR